MQYCIVVPKSVFDCMAMAISIICGYSWRYVTDTFATNLTTVKRIRIITNKPILRGHTSGQRSLAYMNAGAHYMRQMSGLFKEKVNNLRLNAVKDTQGNTAA